MAELVILIIGAVASIVMALLDYNGVIFVPNWANWIPFGISVFIVICMHVPGLADLGDIFD